MRSVLLFAIIASTFQNIQCLEGSSYARLNFFDIDLLRYGADGKPGNVVMSPASIKSTLAMLLEGARGNTAAEIKSSLRVSPRDDDFRKELGVYLQALEVNTTDAILHTANGLFATNKLKLRKEYETILKQVYSTNVNSLNFTDTSAAVKFINNWANLETKGLIPTIVQEVHVNPSSEVVVANALYFKSSWVHSFDPKETHGSCFYIDGACSTVAMMELQAELKYAYMEALRAHAVELPYKGGRYSMILLVPQDRAAESALIRDLPYVGLSKISEQLEPTDVILSLPKFNVDYNEDLVEVLKKMGIQSLFSRNSNLSGIFEGISPYLNSIHHSVVLEVNEGGTVAASTTGALVIPLINSQIQLRVDRPFLFFIRDNKLGLMVFEGKVDDPAEYIEENVVKDDKKQQVTTAAPTTKGQHNNIGGHSQVSSEAPTTKGQNINFGGHGQVSSEAPTTKRQNINFVGQHQVSSEAPTTKGPYINFGGQNQVSSEAPTTKGQHINFGGQNQVSTEAPTKGQNINFGEQNQVSSRAPTTKGQHLNFGGHDKFSSEAPTTKVQYNNFAAHDQVSTEAPKKGPNINFGGHDHVSSEAPQTKGHYNNFRGHYG